MKTTRAVAIAVGCLAIAGWLLHELGSRPRAGEPAPRAQTLAPRATEGAELDTLLAGMTWRDVQNTAERLGARLSLRDDLLARTAGHWRPEALYLRGLLLLAAQRPDESLTAFATIGVERIPPTFLWAPYRLHASLAAGQHNPYIAPLQDARRAGRLPPLIAARVAATAGDLHAALEGYLSSDPSRWANLDLAAFRALGRHAGLRPDTHAMLRAALRADRVPRRLVAEVRGLLAPERPEAIAEMRAQLEELLARDLGARQLATRVTNEQLRVRRLFLARRYHLLVDEHRADRARDLPDATLVLLVLAANQIEASALRDRWSIELRRRYPDPELAAWLTDLEGTAS